MRESSEKEIEGRTYTFSQMGPKQSLKTLVKLSKIVGKPIALMAGGGSAKGLLGKDIAPEILGAAAGAMFEKLDEDETVQICETLTSFPQVLCDGQKVDFNSHYDGKLDLMFKVLMAALEVQYGNFFAGLLGRADSLIGSDTTPAPRP